MKTELMKLIDKVQENNSTIRNALFIIRGHASLDISPTTQIKNGDTSATVHKNLLYMLCSVSDLSVDNYLRDMLSAADNIHDIVAKLLKERGDSIDSEIDEICKKGDGDD